MKDFINKINNKEDLTLNEMQEAINLIMSGMSDDDDIESFLIGLNEKGVSETEVTAAAIVMKEKSLKFDIGDGSHIDTCGTGGTGLHTFNCSTASSFVAAAAGAKITKHGNKAISSKSGSADFLTQSGANINHEREKLISIFDKVGFVFLFAPLHHEAMKFVMPVRQKIAEKTIFNLLGPLVNPSKPQNQITGVYNLETARLYGYIFKNTNKNFSIIYSLDGYDEISLTGNTKVYSRSNEFILESKDFNLDNIDADLIKGGKDVESSSKIFMNVLDGSGSNEQENVVCANASMAISLSKNVSIIEAFEIAKESIKSKSALRCFEKLIELMK